MVTKKSVTAPVVVTLDWECQYRIISSEFPPVDFFEQLVDPILMDELFYIESLTNDRLRNEAGDISLVPVIDRVSGPGSTPVMAAFTHTSKDNPSRFSPGDFGIYYAARTLSTAIAETRYHRGVFLSSTNEDPGEIDMRTYIGEVVKPMHDVRGDEYHTIHDPDDWSKSQVFGASLRETGSWGIVYNSVRDKSGSDKAHCIAAFRPPAVSIPRQGPHLSYVWDGNSIVNIYEKKMLFF